MICDRQPQRYSPVIKEEGKEKEMKKGEKNEEEEEKGEEERENKIFTLNTFFLKIFL